MKKSLFSYNTKSSRTKWFLIIKCMFSYRELFEFHYSSEAGVPEFISDYVIRKCWKCDDPQLGIQYGRLVYQH